jgi:hypothetical protein
MQSKLFKQILVVLALAATAMTAYAADAATTATPEQAQVATPVEVTSASDSEHDTYAMLMAGLVLMGSIALRRSKDGK